MLPSRRRPPEVRVNGPQNGSRAKVHNKMNRQPVLADQHCTALDGVAFLYQMKTGKYKTALALTGSAVQLYTRSKIFVPLMTETNIRPPARAFTVTKCIP